MKRTLLASPLVAAAALIALASPALAAPAPAVTTGSATVVQQTTATLNGFVDDHGHGAVYHFELGTTRSYGSRTAQGTLRASNSTAPVDAGVNGLRPDTTYHYRIVASSGRSTARGRDRTFHTPPIPTQSTLKLFPNPLDFGGPLTVYGSLVGPPPKDNANKQVALQANLWPFSAGFKQVGNSVVTDQNGGYVFTLAPPAFPVTIDTQFRVVDESKPSVSSPVLTELVFPTVKLRIQRLTRPRRGGMRVRFAGTIAPPHNGVKILIQRALRHGRWRTVATAHSRQSGAASTFRRAVRLRAGGRFRVVAVIADGDSLNGTSNSVVIR